MWENKGSDGKEKAKGQVAIVFVVRTPPNRSAFPKRQREGSCPAHGRVRSDVPPGTEYARKPTQGRHHVLNDEQNAKPNR